VKASASAGTSVTEHKNATTQIPPMLTNNLRNGMESAMQSDHSAAFFSVLSEEAVAMLAEIHRLACTSLRCALPLLRKSLRYADCRGSACLSLSVTPRHLGTYGELRFTPRAYAKIQVLGTYETTVMQPVFRREAE
jgi:hypothetical protein